MPEVSDELTHTILRCALKMGTTNEHDKPVMNIEQKMLWTCGLLEKGKVNRGEFEFILMIYSNVCNAETSINYDGNLDNT